MPIKGAIDIDPEVESDHALDRLLGAASTNLDAIVDHVMAPLLQQINMEKVSFYQIDFCAQNSDISSQYCAC